MNPQQPDDNPQVPPAQPIAPEQPLVTPETPVATPDVLPVDPTPQVTAVPEVSAPPVDPGVVAPDVPSAASVVDTPQPPVTPVAEAAQPQAPEAPAPQPFAPAPEASQPFAATPPVQDQTAVPPQPSTGAAPTVFGSGPAPTPEPGKNNKLITLIAAIAGGVVVLALIVWALIAFVFNSVALEPHEGDNFTVLVPKDYEKEESAFSVAFKEPNADSKDQSQVLITTVPTKEALSVMSKSDMIKVYDDSFSEDNMTSSSGFSSDNKITNFKKDESEYQGFDARKITFDVEESGKRTGSGSALIVFGDDSFYIVMVAAHASDPGLAKAANKILNSLEINE